MNDLISRSALLEKAVWVVEYDESGCGFDMKAVPIEDVLKAPAVDAVEVVRCKDCKHGVWDKDEELWKCVISADWNEEVAEYIGFLEYHEADDFCSYGERRADDGRNK